jgi:hypothetical protein
MMNIDELDSVGNKICEWWFLPEGNLAAGDVRGRRRRLRPPRRTL